MFIIFALSVAMEQTYDTAYAPAASAPAPAPSPAIKCTYNHNCDCRDCCEEFDYEYSQRNNRANYNVSTNYVISLD